jgi:phage tail-like protein
MAIDKAKIIDDYPVPVYSYRVTIDGSSTMSFSEVSGLEIDHEHILYRHGFSWIMGDNLIRAQRKPINVTLKRGVTRHRKELYDWLKSEEKKDVSIELCDELGNAIVSWHVTRALPVKLDAPSFSASLNEVAIESMYLIAHDLKITHHE